MDFIELKRKALEYYFSRTNDRQKEAIFQIDGPVLIIAGAGSGKTTVLCNRIANMLLFGNAYHSTYIPDLREEDVDFLTRYVNGSLDNSPEIINHLSNLIGFNRVKPWKILAVTFTNKAANELKERLLSMNAPASDVWASTFHSCCVRILRRSIGVLGFSTNFTIYDTDDSKRVIKNILKDMNISENSFSDKVVMNSISRAKDRLITPERFPTLSDKGEKDYFLSVIREVYMEYQRRLKASNALDFDDIIMKTVEVLSSDSEVLTYWQNHFDYIMVDEYQDTNHAQYELIKLLSGGKSNLCVVGDEDQSIYRFRGATIENILSFEKEFDSKVIKLEQNYRSTSNILNAANSVIENNTQHKKKNLWSDMGEGDLVNVYHFSDEQAEALFVATEVLEGKKNDDTPYKDNAVLYRTNAQSRTFELAFSKMGVPYRIIGGTKFYDRKEIRDIIAYLSVINNPFDTVRFSRIVNEPKRGIGEATQAEIIRISLALGISPIEVMERCEEFVSLSKKAKSLLPLGRMFRELIETSEDRAITDILDDLMEMSGYSLMLLSQGEEGTARLENIKELKSSMITFCEENEDATLFDYLEQVALISDLDSYEEGEDKVVLMTMHAAKGLEFEKVFIVGAEENIFPSYRSTADPYDLEEERRLCYVAITRAKKKLFITTAENRLLYGKTSRNRISRFIGEIPIEYVKYTDRTKRTSFGDNNRGETSSKYSNYLREHAVKPVKTEEEALTFTAGERINHKIFGDGTVISASVIGNDSLLEISFDTVGTKRIMAKFAKVKKL